MSQNQVCAQLEASGSAILTRFMVLDDTWHIQEEKVIISFTHLQNPVIYNRDLPTKETGEIVAKML